MTREEDNRPPSQKAIPIAIGTDESNQGIRRSSTGNEGGYASAGSAEESGDAAGKPMELHPQVRDYALQLGFSLFGAADLRGLEESMLELSPERISGLDRAVSLAVRLSDAVLDEIGDRPTRLYLHHYRQANYFLDRNAFELARFIQELGGRALPIAASQTVDWTDQKGHLSHKEIARRAGLGWVGRNNLLVSPRWGARIRLVTVLTDLPLRIDRPIEEGCGRCRGCLPACPAGAIAEKGEDFDHRKCFEQLKIFKNRLNLGHYICGLCVKACPGRG